MMRAPLRRKGQMETGELLMVVIVVVVLLVLAVVFVIRLNMRNLGTLQKIYADVEAVKVAKRISTLPQVTCDEKGKTHTGCVDRLKLKALNEAVEHDNLVSDYAFNSFGASSVSVTILTGDRRGTTELVYDHPVEGYDGDTSQYPVLIYDPISDQYAFGYWTIRIYVRGRG